MNREAFVHVRREAFVNREAFVRVSDYNEHNDILLSKGKTH